jgi:DMSO/TMAO reductase YedYZ molybdopterin-dependent catalytic subunit
MTQTGQMFRWREAFFNGAKGGFVALFFALLLRLGGLAPFPPEAATEAFISIVPASLEEPAVQQLGDLAGLLTLLVASLATLAAYGILAVLYEKYFRARLPRALSRLESSLLISVAPWLVFGFIFFPLTGYSLFGESSAFASSDTTWLFPITLLFSQFLFGLVLSMTPTPPLSAVVAPSSTVGDVAVGVGGKAKGVTGRREFIERAAILGVSLLLSLTSIGRIASAISQQGTLLSQGGGPINLQNAPAIFRDPRLQSLVDSEVTSNESFYRVAIDLFDPSVSSSAWSLAVSGAVGKPKTYTLADVEALPSVDEYNTFECVSNVVNGNLIGNAKWTGVRISDLLTDVGGLQAGASYLVFYSVDGYTVGIPVTKALMSDSILAYKMNGVSLPVKHGYPLRAVIPGLYGMMSAKWINRIQVVDSVYVGYWQTRGWTNDATVFTQALILIPGDQSSVSLAQNNGSVIFGGVAYAGDRGISKVEVSVDGGKTWLQAQLKSALSNATWTLWAYEWLPSAAGSYNVYVRATDGTGAIQTSAATGTYPNGATGYAMITINVTS